MSLSRIVPRLHWPLIFLVGCLGVVSVWNLQGTTGPFVNKIHISQLYWLCIGGVVMCVVAMVDDHLIKRLAPWIYAGVIILLILVLLIGKKVNGSRRWLDLGVFVFQPSELAKVSQILILAVWLQREPRPGGYRAIDLLPIGLLSGFPMLLIFQEPDLGHTLLIFFITLSMLITERFHRKTVIGSLFTVLALAPLGWIFVLKNYQKERILTLLDQRVDRLGAGWHSHQAEIAVGSGGLIGKGHGMGTQVAGGFLPENHTDFVFAKLAEEYGLFGSTFVLALYLGVILCAIYTAYTAKDRFGTHVALGVAALIFWQVFMNVGMVLNLLPITGVTLPLLSYGGTSALTVMISIGLLLNIHARRYLF
jgi:rod shape determining protein RodA